MGKLLFDLGKARAGIVFPDVIVSAGISKSSSELKITEKTAETEPMFLRNKLKHLVFVLSRVLRGQKLPAKRRDFRVLGTVEAGKGEISAVLQNVSETGVCFVIEDTALPEEFMLKLFSPLERMDRRLRCRRVWANRFEVEGRPYLRVGCAFNESSFRLRWLSTYLQDEFSPAPADVEAA